MSEGVSEQQPMSWISVLVKFSNCKRDEVYVRLCRNYCLLLQYSYIALYIHESSRCLKSACAEFQ